MCGIAGYFGASLSQERIQHIVKQLHHRGPDDNGVYLNNHVGLIHTRLSIIDLSPLGAQPYRYQSLVTVFNGEIYNFKEIREELKKKGYTFQSNSDTEVVIKAYHCWKEECLTRFIGMFAFVIYDEQNDELFAARDRIGVKPFYYSWVNNSFFFASELKVFSDFPIDKQMNEDAVYYYFRFGYIPRYLSVWEGIQKLEAGHFAKITSKECTIKQYWKPSGIATNYRSEEQCLDELEELLISAFRYRMVSDVPVGVFLSGGMDSSLLAAILQKHVGAIHSFTIGFDEDRFDESGYALQVARHLGLHHTAKKLDVKEAGNILTDFYKIYDEPFADTSGIPVSCVTQLAREHGMKVVLSADGGDELFGGYTHYEKANRLFSNMFRYPLNVRKALAKSIRKGIPPKVRSKIVSFNLEHKLYALEELLVSGSTVEFFENFLANQSRDEIALLMHHVTPIFNQQEYVNATSLEDIMYWDMTTYLPDNLLVKVDRATMYHSIECREPLLDHRLIEFALGLPVEYRTNKYILRQLLKRYFPASFFERKKQGFSIPIFKWFSEDLGDKFNQYITPERMKSLPFLNGDEVMREYKKYTYYQAKGKEYNIEKMWRILSLVMWHEAHGK